MYDDFRVGTASGGNHRVRTQLGAINGAVCLWAQYRANVEVFMDQSP
jgi:hypothetical protein